MFCLVGAEHTFGWIFARVCVVLRPKLKCEDECEREVESKLKVSSQVDE